MNLINTMLQYCCYIVLNSEALFYAGVTVAAPEAYSELYLGFPTIAFKVLWKRTRVHTYGIHHRRYIDDVFMTNSISYTLGP